METIGSPLWGAFQKDVFPVLRLWGLNRTDQSQVHGLRDLYCAIAPFSGDEQRLYERMLATGPVLTGGSPSEDLISWCTTCELNRGGHEGLPGVLRIKDLSRPTLMPLIRSVPFVKSFVITNDEMADIYDSGLRVASMNITASQRNVTDDLWNFFTISARPVPVNAYRNYDPYNPINVATLYAALDGITVVVAAGNEGRTGRQSLNPWARPPWVISVGATSTDGSRLLDIPSHGNASPFSDGPTVVASGESSSFGVGHGIDVAIAHIKQAPAPAIESTIVENMLCSFEKKNDGSVSVTLTEPGRTWQLPLEIFEKFGKGETRSAVGTSFAAEYVARLLGPIGIRIRELWSDTIPLLTRPRLLKAALKDMAQPLNNYEPRFVGNGLVTGSIVTNYLAGLARDRVSHLINKAENNRYFRPNNS